MFEGTSCINDPIIISPDLAFRAEATTGEGIDLASRSQYTFLGRY